MFVRAPGDAAHAKVSQIDRNPDATLIVAQMLKPGRLSVHLGPSGLIYCRAGQSLESFNTLRAACHDEKLVSTFQLR